MPRQTIAFTPNKNFNSNTCSATLAATVFMDGPGESVRVVNAGSNPAWMVFGTALQAVNATVGMHIPSGNTEVFTRKGTHARVITSSGQAVLHISVGDGI